MKQRTLGVWLMIAGASCGLASIALDFPYDRVATAACGIMTGLGVLLFIGLSREEPL